MFSIKWSSKMGSCVSKTDELVTKTDELLSQGIVALEAANNLGRTMERVQGAAGVVLPTVKTVAGLASCYSNIFTSFVAAAGVAAQFIQVSQNRQAIQELKEIRQELVAQTGLVAPKKFAKQVCNYIHMKANETAHSNDKHIYFLYHPDNDWHPDFSELIKRRPLPGNFYGMSENLDALSVWMRFLRVVFAERKRWGKSAIFHVLMPAYRPFVIKDPLAFCDKLQPLCLHGLVHNNAPNVRLNLPDAKEDMLDGVGLVKQDIGWFGFKAKSSPRLLGEVPEDADELVINEMRLVRRRRK
ncbi:hypothetical protein BDY21DRAFT_350826 [Lineolata rhizophorae]|uniref:Uncharacterized protein n=1 Tax=Lineolata rhizophorae TaxID=578093 RepID=A0A6A6NUP3_9PEZI|nr:hypothetical protein BDY21DRAFT_350826 [Lineolata rhizophorae]